VTRSRFISFCSLAALCAASAAAGAQQPAPAAPAQQSFKQRFFAHNAVMAGLQPAWPTPLVEPEPRLTQYYRFAFSNQYTSSRTQTVDYGNGRGGGIVAWNRFEFDAYPPGYVQHNTPTSADGFGDTALLMKLRLASANAEHGNYIATFLLDRTFPTGSHTNGAKTGAWIPILAGGKGITRRIDVETALGGTLPTGKIADQGRSISWNALTQLHSSRSTWLEFENNALYFVGGPHDGQMQNFVTPAAFYIYRQPEWAPTHPFLVFTAGMQIATSRFHTYNHNFIGEMRILF
jgi:hypothetical protein